MANPWDIAEHLEIEADPGHPDDRHTIKAVVADLQWDEDPKPGRPEMSGQWLLAHVDGFKETIDLPRASREEAIKEAKRRTAIRLAREDP